MPVLIEKATRLRAAGEREKYINEYFGRLNSGTAALSVAHMEAAGYWQEPGQRPEFDEYTVVLRGRLLVEFEGGSYTVLAGQAVLSRAGEWVRYSTPTDEGAEYVAICLPAFSPDTVHRDE